MIHGIKTSQKGFTIIEVIMFLAISGLMISGLLLAISGGINKERYRDTTNSFIDFIKEQYNLVDNVQNARVPDDGGGPSGCAALRATSHCTIIGRYIESDGEKISSWPIIATNDVVGVLSDPLLDDSDTATVYGAMNLEVSTDIVEMTREHTLRWQTRLVAPSDDTDSELTRGFRMVLLRSPLSGAIGTYVATSPSGSREAMSVIGESEADEVVYFCVDPMGLAPHKTGISINPEGVNSSAVQFASAEECRGA